MDQRKARKPVYNKISPIKRKIAITTGDPLGLGPAVAREGLKRLRPKKGFQFFIWAGYKEKNFKIPPFKTLAFSSAAEALNSPFDERKIAQIKARGGPENWLEEAGDLCLKKAFSALITGPVEKKTIKDSRFKAAGQTDLLKKMCGARDAFMCFRGPFFNTILFTDHIPLKKIRIDQKKLKRLLDLALKARALLEPGRQKKPLGVLGLNPHAGEGGLLGEEEKKRIEPVLKLFSPKEARGPLPPDSAFLKKNWGLYSFFISLYHDQGLIPFKMAHSHKGFAQTLGLPFLRLGVDHGTGKGAKKISSDSFFNALKEALKITKQGQYAL